MKTRTGSIHTSSVSLLTVVLLLMYATMGFAKSNENRIVSYEINPAVVDFASQLPQPVGGYEALMDKVEYPTLAVDAKVEGNVLARVTINDDGSVKDVELLKKIGGGCDESVVNAIKDTKFYYPLSYSDGPKTTIQQISILFRFALKKG